MVKYLSQLSLVLLLGGATVTPALAASGTSEKVARTTWTAASYAEHDASSFFALPEVKAHMKPGKLDLPLLNAAVFYATNEARLRHKLKPFKHSAALERAAQGHSAAMTRHNFFSHTSVVKGQEKMSQRMAREGVSGGYRAENIAQFSGLEYTAGKSVYTPPTNGGYFSYRPKGKPILPRTYAGAGRTVVTQWMNSPGHRRNILNPRLRYLGAGMSPFPKKSFYNMLYFNATQNFASADAR